MATTKKSAGEGDLFERSRMVIWGALVAFGVGTTASVVLTFPWSRMGEPGFYLLDLFPHGSRLNAVILVAHIITAIPPLVIGPWLFIRALLRSQWRRLHVWLRLVYVYCISTSSVTGFLLAMGNRNGVWAKAGFGTLVIVWFVTTLKAYITARNKDWIGHREWMIRSFMITMAVVTVRLLPSHEAEGTLVSYAMMTWACWVPNLVLAEIYVQLTDFRGRLDPAGRKALREKRAARRAKKAREA